MNAEFLSQVTRFVAQSAIPPSALRNQGAPGVVEAARLFLEKLGLRAFVVASDAAFGQMLDANTERLQQAFPEGARHWGAARKAINLFLRDALYNTYLNRAFGLSRIREWLEVPLDSQVAAGLLMDSGMSGLQRWPGIKWLTPAVSSEYQNAAVPVAQGLGVARVDLDLWYFRQNN